MPALDGAEHFLELNGTVAAGAPSTARAADAWKAFVVIFQCHLSHCAFAARFALRRDGAMYAAPRRRDVRGAETMRCTRRRDGAMHAAPRRRDPLGALPR
jgi:hypothetical protein